MLFMEDVGTHALSDERRSHEPARLLPEGRIPAGSTISGARARGAAGRRRSAACCRRASSRSSISRRRIRSCRRCTTSRTVPQVPIDQLLGSQRRQTSERGRDSAEVHFRGIQDSRGRLMVLMSHNTDIADTWEREGESQSISTCSRRAGTPLASTRAVRDDALKRVDMRCDGTDGGSSPSRRAAPSSSQRVAALTLVGALAYAHR